MFYTEKEEDLFTDKTKPNNIETLWNLYLLNINMKKYGIIHKLGKQFSKIIVKKIRNYYSKCIESIVKKIPRKFKNSYVIKIELENNDTEIIGPFPRKHKKIFEYAMDVIERCKDANLFNVNDTRNYRGKGVEPLYWLWHGDYITFGDDTKLLYKDIVDKYKWYVSINQNVSGIEYMYYDEKGGKYEIDIV